MYIENWNGHLLQAYEDAGSEMDDIYSGVFRRFRRMTLQ